MYFPKSTFFFSVNFQIEELQLVRFNHKHTLDATTYVYDPDISKLESNW